MLDLSNNYSLIRLRSRAMESPRETAPNTAHLDDEHVFYM